MNRGRISEIYLQYVRQHCSGIFGVKYDMNQKGLKPEIVNTDAKGCFFFIYQSILILYLESTWFDNPTANEITAHTNELTVKPSMTNGM